MKKLWIFTTLFTASTAALASGVTSVKQAKQAYDNTPVSLSGYIISQIDEDTFIFKDKSGQIRIDVEDEARFANMVSAKAKVRIYGSVDKEEGRTEVDVYRISK